MMRVSARAAIVDGLGRQVDLESPPRAIVSLVPSLTEALVTMGLRENLVGRTAYCVQPTGSVDAIPTIGGTKTPDVVRIVALRPDLVIASAEENVREHVEALLSAGLSVYISLPTTVERALRELEDIARLVDRQAAARPWIDEAHDTVAEFKRGRPHVRRRYFCPIWRRPYMVARHDTYMSDLLHLCSGDSIFPEDGPAHYFPVELAEVAQRAPDVVLLPDEPYPFAAKHIPEIAALSEIPAVRDGRVHLIDGQSITWYGPRIAPSLRALARLLRAG